MTNLIVIVALASNAYTGGGAALFYGAALLVAAWRGQAGCEATVMPNLVLARNRTEAWRVARERGWL